MNLELTSIFRLLESASPLERISSRSVADEILRHQRLSGCGGDTMMVWLDQEWVLSLPKRMITQNEARCNRDRVRKAAEADFYVSVYEDHHGVSWALLLTGHGLPVPEMDMFRQKVKVLASV
jgi:hypothetical protein